MVRCSSQAGSLSVFDNGRYLTRELLVKAIQEALTTLGYNCSIYGGHSFRIGEATVAGCKIP